MLPLIPILFSTLLGLSKSPGTSRNKSPWSPSEWTIILNIGREPGSHMPENWAASGARLVLPLEVLIESDYHSTTTKDIKQAITNKKNEDYLGEHPLRMTVLEDPSFISTTGQQIVPFQEVGAWKLTFRRTDKVGNASRLRFWLDVGTSTEEMDEQKSNQSRKRDSNNKIIASRNDVTLMAGERLYFVTNCWRVGKELNTGLQRYQRIEKSAHLAQENVDNRLSHETGDRRLDGTNPLDTVAASVDMAILIQRRDEQWNELRQAETLLPTTQLSKTAIPGSWPGTDDPLLIAPGTIAVKRKNPIGFLDEYHIIGTFTAKPSDKWEVYEEDDDEEEDNRDEENRDSNLEIFSASSSD